jgi:hypothetical protein
VSKDHTPSVTVTAGTERIDLDGRAALAIGLIVRHAAWFNRTPVGRLVVSFAHGQTKVEMAESVEALHLEWPEEPTG